MIDFGFALGLFGFVKSKVSAGADTAKSLADARYVVIDTELTGLNEKKDSIVSFGAIRMIGGRIDFSDTFTMLVKPETDLSAESIIIHEITPSDVQAQPGINTVLSEFTRFCGSDIVIGHCVSIDLSFINREMKRFSGNALCNPALDTFVLCDWLKRRRPSDRRLPATARGFELYEIAKRLGIPVTGAHNAIMDAFITAQVFQRFIPMLSDAGVMTIGELLKIGNPLKGGDIYRIAGETSNF